MSAQTLVQDIIDAAPPLVDGQSVVVCFDDSARTSHAMTVRQHNRATVNHRLAGAWRHGERRYLVARFAGKRYVYLDRDTILGTEE